MNFQLSVLLPNTRKVGIASPPAPAHAEPDNTVVELTSSIN